MAKYGISLSNDNGRITSTPIASINYDDNKNYLYINNLSASNFVISGAYNSVITISGGMFVTYNAANYSGLYLINNGNIWIPTAAYIPSGSAGGDLFGSYPNPIFKNISNINAGSLQIANGGLGTAGVSNILNSISSGSLVIANSTTNLVAVPTSSYNGIGDWVLGSTNNGTSWGAVPASAPAMDVDVQYFVCSPARSLTTAIWTKAKSNYRWARVMLQGGGGAGGWSSNTNNAAGGGGGGGGFTDALIDISSITSATVTVGNGGTAQLSNTAAPGSPSKFNFFINGQELSIAAQGGGGGTNPGQGGPPGAGGFGLTFIGGAGGFGGAPVPLAQSTAAESSAGAGGGGSSTIGVGTGGGALPGGTGGMFSNPVTNSAGTRGESSTNLFNYRINGGASLPIGFGAGGSGGGAGSPNGTPGQCGFPGGIGAGGGGAQIKTAGALRGGDGGDGFVVVISY